MNEPAGVNGRPPPSHAGEPIGADGGSELPGDRPEPPERHAGRGLVLLLALFVALMLLAQPGTPSRVTVLALIVVAATAGLTLRWRSGWFVVGVLLGVGVALRLGETSGTSDVLIVTEAAIREMLAGGAPYGHGYAESVPPGAPFAYGPLALLWYLPSLDEPVRIELLAAFIVLVALAVRGRLLGLAVYATMPALVVAASRNANDTSAGLLILIALLVAARAPLWGGALLALATAFKPYALAWLPPLIGYGGILGPLVGFLGASAIAWLPALLAWGPEALLWSFRRADEIHGQAYYSLAYGLTAPENVPRPAWQAIRVAAGALLAAMSLVLVRSSASLVIMGSLIFGATLFLGWWSTFAYLSALAPILCWHLDEWLGLGSGRIVWPGDPVGRATAWVDARWPVRRARTDIMGT